MKAKHLFLAIAALLAVGGLWLAWTEWRAPSSRKASVDVGFKTPRARDSNPNSAASSPRASQTGSASGPINRPEPGQTLNSPAQLAPPIPNRRFTDFTPEERVEFARKGHGPGG